MNCLAPSEVPVQQRIAGENEEAPPGGSGLLGFHYGGNLQWVGESPQTVGET
jgi:hypothetical protein